MSLRLGSQGRIRPITQDMVLYTCGMCARMSGAEMKPVSAVLTYINPETKRRYSLQEAIEIVKEINLDPVDEAAAEYEQVLLEDDRRMEEWQRKSASATTQSSDG